MPFYFRVTFLREGRERHVTPAFRDPGDAAPWAEKIYRTNLLAVQPAEGPVKQQALELVLEAPPTESCP